MSNFTITEEIKQHLKEEESKLRAMDREKLSAIYQDILGIEPHPSFLPDFMVRAIIFQKQNDVWVERTGECPKEIRKAIMDFWGKKIAYFSPKSAIREETSHPISSVLHQDECSKKQEDTSRLPGTAGSGLQANKKRNLNDATIVLSVEDEPKEHIEAINIIQEKGENNRISYVDFESWCKKKKIKKSPNLIVLQMKREGLLSLEYAHEDNFVPEEEHAPETKKMTFSEVVGKIEEGYQSGLCVDSSAVDFNF